MTRRRPPPPLPSAAKQRRREREARNSRGYRQRRHDKVVCASVHATRSMLVKLRRLNYQFDDHDRKAIAAAIEDAIENIGSTEINRHR
jgi:hypothetical protein